MHGKQRRVEGEPLRGETLRGVFRIQVSSAGSRFRVWDV